MHQVANTSFSRQTIVMALFTAMMAGRANAAEPELSFNRDIRPILSANCFACHGFDSRQRKADLRLDLAEGAFAVHDGQAAIKPGDLAASEVWRRLISDDPDVLMPPPSTRKKLTDDQKLTIRRWIEQGAKYQKHWAFELPLKAPIPANKNPGWARNDLDRFIAAKLDQAGLTPQAEAPRSTLIRRVAFALTGLPPTIAEVDAFEADQSPEAYERMVDQYLKSLRYGEEMARHWLDVARYADTHGLHLDNERSMWAYRDWVIRSFNKNQHFDDFTRDQLAGDLRDNPTPEQLVGTGFNRCNVTTSEGGAIESEWIYRYAVDRTSTTIQTWMGLTGGCAVCHDHKYDPLSSREFYSMYAFFYSAADPGMDRNTNNTDPYFKLTTADQKVALEQLRVQEQQARQQFESCLATFDYQDPAELNPAPARISIEDIWLDDQFPAGSRPTCSSRNPSVWSTAPEVEPPLGCRALKQFGASNYQDKFENPTVPFVIPDNALVQVSVRVDSMEPSAALMLELFTSRGNRRVHWGDPARYGKSTDDKNWLGKIPAVGQWVTLNIPIDTLDLKAGDSIRGVALAQHGGIAWWDALKVTGDVQPATDVRSSFAAWWKERAAKETPGIPGDLASLLKGGPPVSKPDDVPDAEKAIQAASDRARLLKYYLVQIARIETPAIRQLQLAWQSAAAARAAIEESIPGTFIFRDLDKPRDAFVMQRGQYDKPGEKVEPNVPAAFPPLKPRTNADGTAVRPNRLDLAEWLLAPEQPLTARVTVNRFWQQFFGTGLVMTSYDFGSQGDPPSHPELLDWLAIWYREHNWDTKALVRLMVTSATFRQQSRVTPELLRLDPHNRLYARGPRFRLDAEQIRDNALYVSGLINLEMGGRGVNSYQPPNIWEPVGYSDSNTRFYLQDHGKSLYRRSIYTFLKRTAPPPFMSNFDGPNREQFCTIRERSNTPLQALQLLNDTQHFEAARAFAERILSEGGPTVDGRIRYAYRATLSRSPEPDELAVVQRALKECLTRYQNDPAAANKAIAVGESKPSGKFDPSELAAYTLISNLILNLDETVMRN
ncbi:MAG: PSD1 domain-containing protein [Planctomycetes bacterium]|nr:PSD1 domain-containing protein [Planctomycetota bacterium]